MSLLKALFWALVILAGSVIAPQVADIVIYNSPVKSETNPDNSLATKALKTYGPVTNNEGLWDIASQLRPDESITITQMAVALFHQNPKAFINNNINGLLTDVILSVPNKNQIMQLSKDDAERIFNQHWQYWQNPEIQAVKTEITNKSKVKQNAQITSLEQAQNLQHPESQMKFKHAINNIVDDSAKLIKFYWRTIQSNVVYTSSQMANFSLPVKIISIIIFVFLLLIYFLKKQEINYIRINPPEILSETLSEPQSESLPDILSETPPEKAQIPEPVIDDKLSEISEVVLIDSLATEDTVKTEESLPAGKLLFTEESLLAESTLHTEDATLTKLSGIDKNALSEQELTKTVEDRTAQTDNNKNHITEDIVQNMDTK